MATDIVARAEALFQARQHQQGMAVLAEAAKANDADALAYLANMSVAGTIVHRDLKLARDLFRRSASAGSTAGAAAYRAFLANGTGGPPDWQGALTQLEEAARTDPAAKQELDIIQTMTLADDGGPAAGFESRRLSESPKVWLFPGLFSEAECGFLMGVSEPQLGPSLVVDPATGQLVSNPVRTSDATGFPLVAEGPAIHALNRRLAAASGTGVKQGEPLQVLRYRPGQEYRPHFDAIDGADNQRILTFLVYLNDGFEGGETEFLSSGLKVKGSKGDGLLFRNADAAGVPDRAARHAGLPVTKGEKYLASRWIRERPLISG